MDINVRNDMRNGMTGSGRGYGRGEWTENQGNQSYGQGNQGSPYQGNQGNPQSGFGHDQGRQGQYGSSNQGQHQQSNWNEQGTQRGRGRWQKEHLTAREIMTSNVKTATTQSTLKDVAQIMKDENVGVIPVVDENRKLIGVITDRDLVIRTLAGGKNPLEQKVEDVMTDDVEAVTPDESIHDVLDLMGSKMVRRVPVVDQNDRLLGIISMADIATRADHDEELQMALEKISARRSFWSKLGG